MMTPEEEALRDLKVWRDPPRPAAPARTPYDTVIQAAAVKYGLDEDLLRRVIRQESGGNPRAVSPAGAQGLMQLMPATAKALGVRDPFDPAQNVDGGARYLRQQLDAFNGDERLALAAYNAGPGNVRKYQGVPPFRETQEYVARITRGRLASRGGSPTLTPEEEALRDLRLQGEAGLSPEDEALRDLRLWDAERAPQANDPLARRKQALQRDGGNRVGTASPTPAGNRPATTAAQRGQVYGPPAPASTTGLRQQLAEVERQIGQLHALQPHTTPQNAGALRRNLADRISQRSLLLQQIEEAQPGARPAVGPESVPARRARADAFRRSTEQADAQRATERELVPIDLINLREAREGDLTDQILGGLTGVVGADPQGVESQDILARRQRKGTAAVVRVRPEQVGQITALKPYIDDFLNNARGKGTMGALSVNALRTYLVREYSGGRKLSTAQEAALPGIVDGLRVRWDEQLRGAVRAGARTAEVGIGIATGGAATVPRVLAAVGGGAAAQGVVDALNPELTPEERVKSALIGGALSGGAEVLTTAVRAARAARQGQVSTGPSSTSTVAARPTAREAVPSTSAEAPSASPGAAADAPAPLAPGARVQYTTATGATGTGTVVRFSKTRKSVYVTDANGQPVRDPVPVGQAQVISDTPPPTTAAPARSAATETALTAPEPMAPRPQPDVPTTPDAPTPEPQPATGSLAPEAPEAPSLSVAPDSPPAKPAAPTAPETATPAETPQGSPAATGLANQVQEREALAEIIREPEKGVGQGAEYYQQRGRELVDAGEADPQTWAREIAEGKRGISADAFGVMLEGKRRLLNSVNAARKALDEALDAKAAAPDVARLRGEYDQAKESLNSFLNDVQKGKGEWSNAGRALQAGTQLDTGDFASVLAEARRVKGGALDAGQEQALKDLTDRVKNADARVAELEAEAALQARLRDLATADAHKLADDAVAAARAEWEAAGETATKGTRRAATRKRIAADRAAIEKEIADILKSGPNLTVGADPFGAKAAYEAATYAGRLTKAGGKWALTYIREGVVDLDEAIEKTIADFAKRGADITRRQILEGMAADRKEFVFSEAAQNVAALKAEAKHQQDLLAKLNDEERAVKTKPASRPKSQSTQDLEAQVAEKEAARKAAEKAARAAEKAAAREAEIKREIAEINARLRTRQPGPPQPGKPRPTKTGDQQRLAELRAELREQERLRAELAGQKPVSTPSRAANPNVTPETQQLRDEVAAQRGEQKAAAKAQRELDRAQRQKAKLDAEIAETEERIRQGRPKTPKPGEPRPTQTLDGDRKRLAELRAEEREQARLIAKLEGQAAARPKPTPNPNVSPATLDLRAQAKARAAAAKEARRIANEKAATQKRLDQVNAQLANLNASLEAAAEGRAFELRPPKGRKAPDAELADLRAQRDLLKREVESTLESLKPRTPGEKLVNLIQIPKTLRSSIDISAPGRQGWLLGVSRPKTAMRAFSAQMEALRDPVAAMRQQNEILSRPNAGLYRRSGLYLSTAGGIGPGEEAFAGRIFTQWKRNNPIAASERAYTAYLNRLRADSFDQLVGALGDDATPEQLKSIARYINHSTGRGGSGMQDFSMATRALNVAFFSPRFALSRWEYLIHGAEVLGKAASGRSSPETKVLAKEYGKVLLALGTILGLAKAAGSITGAGDVEHDMRSSDFGKIRIGERRISVLAGLEQVMTLAARSTTRSTKKDGKISPADVPTAAWRYFRGKLAPTPSAALNLANGEDYMGRPYHIGNAILDLVAPMTPTELAIGISESNGLDFDDALDLLNFLGFSVQNHEEKSKPQ